MRKYDRTAQAQADDEGVSKRQVEKMRRIKKYRAVNPDVDKLFREIPMSINAQERIISEVERRESGIPQIEYFQVPLSDPIEAVYAIESPFKEGKVEISWLREVGRLLVERSGTDDPL